MLMTSLLLSATPAHANSAEVDLLGSLSLAIVPTVSTSATSEAESQAPTFAAAPVSSNVKNQVAMSETCRMICS